MTRCPTCGRKVPSIFEHVDKTCESWHNPEETDMDFKDAVEVARGGELVTRKGWKGSVLLCQDGTFYLADFNSNGKLSQSSKVKVDVSDDTFDFDDIELNDTKYYVVEERE